MNGRCAPGFEPVREAFERNFADRGEVGAAVAVTVGGELVVDLWAGWADAERTVPWREDTLTNVWSTTKGVVAIAAHQLADRGELDLDAPVARYWPEFAAEGKDAIPVRWLLSHRSGVVGIGLDRPVTVEELYDWEHITGLLAAQAPLFAPGTASGYHALSYGFLVGEVIRRVSGQTAGEYLAEHVAGPLGADFVLGLGDADLPRCSSMIEPVLTSAAAQALATAFANAGPVALAAMANPRVEGHHANADDWRRAELPALNGHGTARAVATIYGALADGSQRLLSDAALATARAGQGREVDVVGGLPNEWALGFYLGSEERGFGPNPLAFGHDGFGGSSGGADPEAGVGFGYVMNQMGPLLRDDPRKLALVAALYSCLG
ncbi:serine hydrolase domain-containing protein [Amycolatopsis suaedae]|uniref:Class A beta-lactamase-related serine hydrolase n=1 Tax=Amycolatopsis suaedae TaxID=2510978 RepID=A0A4Q7JE22_9PSEU|nr:serine hydrolase domain-containing protein [Amycolatopsis suaedae]RZQ65719.1 class A beta-lactamase-related serine hydrolase [Amycolatopsis suaedae]